MSSWIKLVYGEHELALNSGNYSVLEGFSPPTAGESGQYAGEGYNLAGPRLTGLVHNDRGWTFEIEITGGSSQEVHMAARRLQGFLDLGQEKLRELYLEYVANVTIPYRPIWGQWGVRYHIKHGLVETGNIYSGYGSGHVMRATVRLVIGPYALGLEQDLLSSVTGGLQMDTLSAPPGQPRGLQVCPSRTNYFTNPVFYADWDGTSYSSGWTIGSDLATWQNVTLREYIPNFAEASMGVVRTGGTNIRLTQSINVGGTQALVLSVYAKRLDGAAVTNGLIKIYYNGATVTTSVQTLEDGWYRVYASTTGVASSVTAGVQIDTADVAVFLCGFLTDYGSLVGDFPSPYFDGSTALCAWSGTAHQSTSTRGAAALLASGRRLFKVDRLTQFSVRISLRWHYPSTWGQNLYFFDFGAIEAYYNATDDKIYLTDGTNTISTAAQTFSAGDLVVLHFVAGLSGMKIYKNGVEAATGNTFADAASTGNFYLFCESSPANQLCASVLDCAMWHEVASAGEVLADYTDIYEQISSGDGSGESVSATPWVYSVATMRKYDDTGLAIIGGVSGNAPAKSEIRLGMTAQNSLTLAHNHWYEMWNLFAEDSDLSGTVVAGALGGQCLRTSINTTETAGASTINLGLRMDAYWGKQVYILVSLADAGANLQARLTVDLSSAFSVSSEWQNIAADATLRNFLIGPLSIPDESVQKYKYGGTAWSGWETTLNLKLMLKRSVAGAANVDVDWYVAVFGNAVYIPISHADSAAVILDEGLANAYNSTLRDITEQPPHRGDPISLIPGQYNALRVMVGTNGAAAAQDSMAAVVNQITITPRWKIF